MVFALRAADDETDVGTEGEGAQRGLMVPSLLPDEYPRHALLQYWPPRHELLQTVQGITPFGFRLFCVGVVANQCVGFAEKGSILLEYGRLYEMQFLPGGLFSRLMVRAIHLPAARLLLPWRRGFLLQIVRPFRLFNTCFLLTMRFIYSSEKDCRYGHWAQRNRDGSFAQ